MMNQLSDKAIEQLRKAGITDVEIDALRRSGSITTIGADGVQTTVTVGEGGRVVMSTTTTTTTTSSAPVASSLSPSGQQTDSGSVVRPLRARAFVSVPVVGVLLGLSVVLTYWGAKQLAVIGNCGTSNYYQLAVQPCPSGVVEATLAGIFGIVIFGLFLLVKQARRLKHLSLIAIIVGIALGSTVMWDALPEPVTKDSRDAATQEVVEDALS